MDCNNNCPYTMPCGDCFDCSEYPNCSDYPTDVRCDECNKCFNCETE